MRNKPLGISTVLSGGAREGEIELSGGNFLAAGGVPLCSSDELCGVV